ncbi:type I 3-dehydroquinate dehydratase [Floccifex sp.]|uniref:type I 3-dehydroquinate dehydratase n=1 Tax=Floccifex sp. TaxID=2815810 RepID=UPI002A7581EC|nr:type I 3-dehydroquinate dehydratase [Floccifex sp.]MDD7281190.1 type I 3-dehydroquinate dehydratase [Erysipelotrichaceae bacterium]MDY2958073.1 type I 3-dehydroquinate dehydratase [Floccifex sp.]
MQIVNIKNIEFGKGKPKICVPIMGSNINELEKEINGLDGLMYDVVEWRMDYYDFDNIDALLQAVHFIHNKLKKGLLLATFRTSNEGGVKEISDEQYRIINEAIILSGNIDLVDIEYFRERQVVQSLLTLAHENNVCVIMSNHDFEKTPSYEQMINRLDGMHEMGADIAKLAVMPNDEDDVFTLLKATNDCSSKPIITMSMGKIGLISRLTGEIYGSCMTFGCADKASAPGQINANELNTVLDVIHNADK